MFPEASGSYFASMTLVDRDLKEVGLRTFEIDRDGRPSLTEIQHRPIEPIDKAPRGFEVLSEKGRHHVRLRIKGKLGVEECCVSDDRAVLSTAVGGRHLSFQPRARETGSWWKTFSFAFTYSSRSTVDRQPTRPKGTAIAVSARMSDLLMVSQSKPRSLGYLNGCLGQCSGMSPRS